MHQLLQREMMYPIKWNLVHSFMQIAFIALLGCCLSFTSAVNGNGLVVLPAQHVDQLLQDEVFSQHSLVALAPLTDDLTYLRRVYLDLTGQLPTSDEMKKFASSSDPNKRSKLVDRLLLDSKFGTNWGRYWRDVILYRRTEDRAIVVTQSLTDYLAQHFRDNTPWDEIAQEFVTATGNVTENGNTAIIFAQSGEPENTAAEISRIFMGIQIQCAQCHDHPFDRWKREQFHELAAFFPRIALRRERVMGQQIFHVLSHDRPDRHRKKVKQRVRGTLEHRMSDLENPSSPGKIIQPSFFATGQKLALGVSDAQRRAALATWMTSANNEWFSKAFVNRIWSELVGEGFVEPIDDLGPDRDIYAPKTLAYLSAEFVSHGHDIHWLFRTIMATEAYQRTSRPRGNADDVRFSANRPQPLRSDQLHNVFLQSVDADNSDVMNNREKRRRKKYRGQRVAFQNMFGYDPSQPRDEIVASIPQALTLMNSPQVNRAILSKRALGLRRWLLELEDDQLVHELYVRCLARKPTKVELATCLAFVRNVGDRQAAFEDILWTLVNSVEFRFRI